MKRSYGSYELIVAPPCEAGLLLLAGAAAMLVHKPLFFASLGPTAYELAETPERKSAQPYSVILWSFDRRGFRLPSSLFYASLAGSRDQHVLHHMGSRMGRRVGRSPYRYRYDVVPSHTASGSVHHSHNRHGVDAAASRWPGYHGGNSSSYHRWRTFTTVAAQAQVAAHQFQDRGC